MTPDVLRRVVVDRVVGRIMARPAWGPLPHRPGEVRELRCLMVRDVVGGSRGRYDRRWVRMHLPTYEHREELRIWPGEPIPWPEIENEPTWKRIERERYVPEPVPGEAIIGLGNRRMVWRHEAIVRLRRFPLPGRCEGVIIGGPVTRVEGEISPRGEEETGHIYQHRTISNLLEVLLVDPPVPAVTRLASIVLVWPDDVTYAEEKAA